MLRILIPVDGSESSTRAVDCFIRKCNWYKETPEIHLLNVQPPIASGGIRLFISQDQLNAYYHDEGLKALKPARERLDAAAVPYGFHIGVGDPAEVIARYAKEKQCDQIFMGTRGLSVVPGLLLGSVTMKVIHLAEVPVLLVK